MRRLRALAAVLLALAPATPGWAALTSVELAPSAPAAAPSAPLLGAAAAPLAPSALETPALAAPALAPAFAASVPALQSPEPAAAEAVPAAAAAPAPQVAPGRKATDSPNTAAVLHAAAATPSDAGRLFDAAPAAPNFEALSPARTPQAPAAWSPRSALLKPAALAVNAWNAARHERRLSRLGPDQRVTAEEEGLRQSLTQIHAAISAGRLQDAIDVVAKYFETRAAMSWHAQNPRFRPYKEKAFEDMRFVERAVLNAYVRADARGADPALIAEARAGVVLGHEWRPTAIQDKDSSHCVQNSLYNAIAASVGFARPTTVAEFVAASRAALNREAKLAREASPAQIAALSRRLGVDFGRRDVGEGMGTGVLEEWASLLGLAFAERGPPSGDAGWSALIGPGRETLLSLRMFHPKYAYPADAAAAMGHDYALLHHEVYLLGAFDSPSRGARLYMLQDSGSGATLMATAEELSALTQEVQVVGASAPVSLPGAGSPR